MNAAISKSVLFIGAFPRPAALERFVSGDLAGRLKGCGWKVRLTSRQPGRLARLGSIILGTWFGSGRCGIACVDVFSGPAFLWAEAACAILRRGQRPYVLILHGGNLPEFAARWPGRVRRLLSSAKTVTAPSHYLKERVERYCGRIQVLPNPIDIELYPYRERATARPKLVWLRAFHGIYNPVMAVRTVAALAREFPEVELAMIGPDKGDGSLQRTKAEAHALGVTGRIKFTGQVAKSDVPRALAGADVFLNSTNFDNTPVSVVEAMACGLCIVSTDVGGVPYLCSQGKDALLVAPDDHQAMASAVRKTLINSELSGLLSRNARAKAESFDWSVILPQWEKLLIEVAQPTTGRLDYGTTGLRDLEPKQKVETRN